MTPDITTRMKGSGMGQDLVLFFISSTRSYQPLYEGSDLNRGYYNTLQNPGYSYQGIYEFHSLIIESGHRSPLGMEYYDDWDGFAINRQRTYIPQSQTVDSYYWTNPSVNYSLSDMHNPVRMYPLSGDALTFPSETSGLYQHGSSPYRKKWEIRIMNRFSATRKQLFSSRFSSTIKFTW